MHVDLDHPWIGCDQQCLDPRVRRRSVAFQNQADACLGCGAIDQSYELEELFQPLHGRQENVYKTVSGLENQCRTRWRIFRIDHHCMQRISLFGECWPCPDV